MSKISIPEGMLKAADQAFMAAWNGSDGAPISNAPSIALEAALQWATENPQVPTSETINAILKVCVQTIPGKLGMIGYQKGFCVEWQRRMWLAPEPEFDATLGGALNGRTWTQEQADALIRNIETATHGYQRNAPEPEVPEAIKDLLSDGTNDEPGNSDNRVLEAYRRGLGLV